MNFRRAFKKDEQDIINRRNERALNEVFRTVGIPQDIIKLLACGDIFHNTKPVSILEKIDAICDHLGIKIERDPGSVVAREVSKAKAPGEQTDRAVREDEISGIIQDAVRRGEVRVNVNLGRKE